MLTREGFRALVGRGTVILDGATGSNLRMAGMPQNACTEQWVLSHPEILIKLQKEYVRAGSRILYAATFQAQPVPLARVGLERDTEKINASLVALSRSAAPEALIAGNLTTLAAFLDSWEPKNYDLLVENYRRQIRGLIDGGADLLAAETLMNRQEAEAIFTAAELEGAGVVMYSFPMQPDGSLFSGADALPLLRELEESGAAAVGFNCVAADDSTPALVSRLRRVIRGPLLCKPNAGNPVIRSDGLAEYPLSPDAFAEILFQCAACGAGLLGGCCGTTPEFIRLLHQRLS